MPEISDEKREQLATLNDVSGFVALKNLIYLREQVEIDQIKGKLQTYIME